MLLLLQTMVPPDTVVVVSTGPETSDEKSENFRQQPEIASSLPL